MKNQILTIATILFFVNANFAQDLEFTDINAKGKVKMNGNTGTAGQVLTSNGALAPTWSTLTAPTIAVGGKFSYRMENVTSQTVANNVDNLFSAAVNASSSQSAFVSFGSGGGGIDYNTNSDVTVDVNTGLFTFNRAGLYHFEGMLRFTLGTPVAQAQTDGLGVSLSLHVNGTTTPHLVDQKVMPFNGPVNMNFNQYGATMPFEFNRYFTAGGTVRLRILIFNITNAQALSVIGLNSGGYVSGHFVSE
jgi:hypothetical protein